MVKYTTSLPYIGSSESDSKIYITFEFCEVKSLEHLKKHIDLQSQIIYVEEFIFKKSLHILEDGASSVQNRYVEHVIV